MGGCKGWMRWLLFPHCIAFVSLSKIIDRNYGGLFLRLLSGSLLVSQCIDNCSSTVSLKVGFYCVSITTLLVTLHWPAWVLSQCSFPHPSLSFRINLSKHRGELVDLHIALELGKQLNNRVLVWPVQGPGFNSCLCSKQQELMSWQYWFFWGMKLLLPTESNLVWGKHQDKSSILRTT